MKFGYGIIGVQIEYALGNLDHEGTGPDGKNTSVEQFVMQCAQRQPIVRVIGPAITAPSDMSGLESRPVADGILDRIVAYRAPEVIAFQYLGSEFGMTILSIQNGIEERRSISFVIGKQGQESEIGIAAQGVFENAMAHDPGEIFVRQFMSDLQGQKGVVAKGVVDRREQTA